MAYVPITPFGRTVDAAVIAHQAYASQPLPPEGVNKWEVLRQLSVAQTHFQLTDRTLCVLQALLSFHPETILGGNSDALLVYPSNAAICERLNGMACSTMRRHLAVLVHAGLILRRDSPNGKRFVKRSGGEPQAFGFDLTPLAVRFSEICEISEAAQAEQDHFQRLRRSVSLMRRDLAGLAVFGAETRPELRIWDAFSDLALLTARDLRRKLTHEALEEIEVQLLAALNHARDVIDGKETVYLGTNDACNEQHIQNSNKEGYVSEPSLEKGMDEILVDEIEDGAENTLPNIPIALVTAVCLEIQNYVPEKPRHWHELVRAAEIVSPMMGISPSAWNDAVIAMGPEEAAVVVLAMLERFSEIKSPGGYLRHLTSKAEQGAFSCGPMVMALMHKQAA